MAEGDEPTDRDPDDLASKIPLFAELDKLMSWRDGPVNWDLARQVAIKAVSGNDPKVGGAEAAAAADALRLADLWLNEVTALPSGLLGPAEAWNRVRWIEATLPVWRTVIDAVAEQVTAAMGTTLQQGLQGVAENGLPPEVAAMLPPEMAAQLPSDASGFSALLGPMMGMLGQVGGLLFGTQIGQALGALAGDVLTATEVGLPLAPAGTTALLPGNVSAFGVGLQIPADEIRLFLALREVAAARLFGHVPWLRAGLLGAVEEYAQGIRVDPEQVMRGMESFQSSFDPSSPDSLSAAISEGMFDVPDTAEQQRALNRLETLLALVEGWIDTVTAAASEPRLPHASALRETVRRRRAAGGPAETTFTTLVGLTMRPRRLREAAAVWEGLATTRGIDGRDAVWSHPDLLPSAEQLDDPAGFVTGQEGSSTDDPIAAIEALAAAGNSGPREASGIGRHPQNTTSESDPDPAPDSGSEPPGDPSDPA